MTAEDVKAFCLSLPSAHSVVQWAGTTVFKVDAKMFAALLSDKERVVLKCADQEMANMLVEAGIGHWAKYFGQKQWVGVSITPVVMPDEELRARLEASYKIVRNSLTKKIQSSLAPLSDD